MIKRICTYIAFIFLLFTPLKTEAKKLLRKELLPDNPADSLMEVMIERASTYNTRITDYTAQLYTKGFIQLRKKNFLSRFLPKIIRLKNGVNEYIIESFSDLHYTAPSIYDQKLKAVHGTVRSQALQTAMMQYFKIAIYSNTLLDNSIISPLAPHARKYYHYNIDSITYILNEESPFYHVRFTPRLKSHQLVEGSMDISSKSWTVRKISMTGHSKLYTFTIAMTFGKEGESEELLPLSYQLNTTYTFLGNVLDHKFETSLMYQTIHTETAFIQKSDKRKHDLTESFHLRCDTTKLTTDSTTFKTLRPYPLDSAESRIYRQHSLQLEAIRPKRISTWKNIGDFLLSDIKLNISKDTYLQSSPLINPFLLSYSGSSGFSWSQLFKYRHRFKHDRHLWVSPKIGYNFSHKEFYWSINSGFEYWPQKRASIKVNIGNGNRIYSQDVMNDLKNIPDSIFDFNHIHLDYFKDFYVSMEHRIEVVNGLEIAIGFSRHRRDAIKKSKLVVLPTVGHSHWSPDEIKALKLPSRYISFAPKFRIKWTPGLYYYYNGKRKINLRSKYPTFSLDYERGINGVWGGTSEYERIEWDIQHHIHLKLLRSIYYRIGFGAFTNQRQHYFVDFTNFASRNLPIGWNDDLGGVFQLLDRRWYNSSEKYIRGHLTYESPFLFMRHLFKYSDYVLNERIYANVLVMPHLRPYLELGYGIGTLFFDVGVFVGTESFRKAEFGCKFTFELFNKW